MQNMKMKSMTIILMALLFGLSVTAGAWCIIRDNGSTEIPAGSGLYLQNCCTGNPRIWQDADIPVSISILNTTAAAIQTDIRNAHDEWTNLTASTFAFSNGGITTIELIRHKTTPNVVAIPKSRTSTKSETIRTAKPPSVVRAVVTIARPVFDMATTMAS